jgi:hypothetical protein
VRNRLRGRKSESPPYRKENAGRVGQPRISPDPGSECNDSEIGASTGICGASLGWTAEGGCPHMDSTGPGTTAFLRTQARSVTIPKLVRPPASAELRSAGQPGAPPPHHAKSGRAGDPGGCRYMSSSGPGTTAFLRTQARSVTIPKLVRPPASAELRSAGQPRAPPPHHAKSGRAGDPGGCRYMSSSGPGTTAFLRTQARSVTIPKLVRPPASAELRSAGQPRAAVPTWTAPDPALRHFSGLRFGA